MNTPSIAAQYEYEEPELFEGCHIKLICEDEFLPLKEALPDTGPRDLRDLQHMIDVGAMQYFQAIVEATRDTPDGYPRRAVGTAALGACIYDKHEDFHVKYREDYYMDLVREAAKQACLEHARVLTELFPNLNQQYSFERAMGYESPIRLVLTPERHGRDDRQQWISTRRKRAKK